MTFENFLNWTVSIDCGPSIGNYQGQIKSVDGANQTLTLTNAFLNGILIEQDLITIKAKDIRDLNLLSQPGSSYQIPKTIQKKSNQDISQQQSKPAPIANNGNKSIGTNVNQSNRNRSSKSLSDEGINENEVNEEVINRDPTIRPLTCQLADKYRCDQMILEHNNGPIDYEQIQLPV
ncbi:unnamed protein product, partial [Adineta ricciae]